MTVTRRSDHLHDLNAQAVSQAFQFNNGVHSQAWDNRIGGAHRAECSPAAVRLSVGRTSSSSKDETIARAEWQRTGTFKIPDKRMGRIQFNFGVRQGQCRKTSFS